MKNQIGSSRMDTVLKMLLIAFISLLAFSSGVYFGKQLSDSDYQLKALEGDFNHTKTKTAANKPANDMNPEDAIAEEEVAALSEKLVKSEKEEMKGEETRKVASEDGHQGDTASSKVPAPAVPTKDPKAEKAAMAEKAAPKAEKAAVAEKPAPKAEKAAPVTEKPAPKVEKAVAKEAPAPAKEAAVAKAEKAAPAGKPDLSAAQKAAERVANNAAPAEPAKAAPEARVPSSLPKTVGISGDVEFTVQVASYPTMDAAKESANDLVKKGFPAFPVEAVVNGKTWYRVSVGSFKSQKEASAYRAQLIKQNNIPSAIVQRIQR